ncbi:MAG: hypothetical protein WA085_03005 [Sphingobium sp.]
MSEEAALALMEAREDLEPLRQGELDSLCGFYALINAVRLLAYPDKHLHQRDLTGLFRTGVKIFSQQRRLKFALSWGLYHAHWDQFLGSFLPEIEAVAGFRIRQHRVFKTKAQLRPSKVVCAIRRHLNCGHPVVLILGGAYDHWTVISGYSEHRLHLFDSSGYCWINTRSITLDEHLTNGIHFLSPNATWAFERITDLKE